MQIQRHSSIGQRFQREVNKCDICFSSYNRQDQQPVIICSNHHTVCKACMKGLEASRKCPFCRESIRFDKVVVNNYIFDLLPNQAAAEPNVRQNLQNPPNFQQQNAPLYSYQPPQANYNQEPQSNYNQQRNIAPGWPANPNQLLNQEQVNPNSINQQPIQYVYNGDLPNQDYDPQASWQHQNTSMCICNQVQTKLELNSDRQAIYTVIFILQVPFVFLDLYFAFSYPKSQCMDQAHQNIILILRPWLQAMGIVGLGTIALIFLFAILYICKCCTLDSLKCAQKVSVVCLLLKALIWMFMELSLFGVAIVPFCSGGLYAYGILMTIIHAGFLLILCALGTCKR